MNKNKKYFWRLISFVVAILIILVGLFFIINSADAEGFFDECNYLNNCETFGDMGDFQISNYKDGILVKGTVPDADLSTSGNPLEIIVTTGDVYTHCSNSGQPYSVTGNVLYDEIVQPGDFIVYLPLAEGDYNITVYMGQSECANCPRAKVFPITVKHKKCDKPDEYIYLIPGNFICPTEPISKELGGGSWAINRMKNPAYTSGPNGFCSYYDCEGNFHVHVRNDKPVIVKRVSGCYVPKCPTCNP